MKENQPNIKLPEKGSVLISGGSGLIGRYLTSLLLSEGYRVSHLSRKVNQFGKVRVFRWDPEKGILDPVIFEGIDCIVHLAGTNIGEKRWTKSRKEEILNSRVGSAKLLLKGISENRIKLKTFVSSSAIGYYGSVTSEKIFSEQDSPSEDFLGSICRQWEESADEFTQTGARVVKIRTGVVMEKSDSALAKLLKTARWGLFPRLGTGQQYMPWIHIEDLCRIYLKAIQDDKMIGSFNAVSPQHMNQIEFMRTLAKSLNKPFFHPPIPSFFLRMILGDMADVALKGSRVASEKIRSLGYKFQYNDLKMALNQIFKDIE
jgi:uncharacterized protein